MKKVWIAVVVESGIPTEIEIFSSYQKANKFSLDRISELNMEDDSLEIFEKELCDME